MDGRPHPVLVVLDDEDDRQLEQCGHVQRLVEGADVGDRVAEETDADRVAVAVTDRVADTDRDGQVTADDGVSAEEVVRAVEQMHRAALALRATPHTA